MAITTTDVVTNIVSGNDYQNTGAVVVSCPRTGMYNSIDPTYQKDVTYNDLESRYTERFDDVTYYTIGTATVVGG